MVTTNVKEHCIITRGGAKKIKLKMTAIANDLTSCRGVVMFHQALHENLTDVNSTRQLDERRAASLMRRHQEITEQFGVVRAQLIFFFVKTILTLGNVSHHEAALKLRGRWRLNTFIEGKTAD